MIGVEEILGVVAGRREASPEQAETELVGMYPCREAHLLEQGGIDTQLIVLDIVAIDPHGGLEVFVDDLVTVRLHRLDHPIPDPLAQAGKLAKPAIGVGFGGRFDDSRDLGVLGRRLPLGVFKVLLEAGEQGLQQGGCNNGHSECSFSGLMGFVRLRFRTSDDAYR
ncbi:hypothetical protein D3C85_994910 [compost metagenome]